MIFALNSILGNLKFGFLFRFFAEVTLVRFGSWWGNLKFGIFLLRFFSEVVLVGFDSWWCFGNEEL